MRTAKRAVLVQPRTPVEIWDEAIPSPGPGDVLVAVELAGVCGTDHHFWLGELPLPGPIVLGHEGIGRIVERGAEVSTDSAGERIEEGDLVYWLPLHPCHRCHACTILEDTSMCHNTLSVLFQDARLPPTGTYSEYAQLKAGQVFFRIPPDTPTAAVISFGCAMPTMLQAMERLGGVGYGQSVVVQGCGPVGLAAVLLARIGGAGEITVIGAPSERLAMASRLGATQTIDLDATDEDSRVQAIKASTGGRGADVVIEAAGKIPAFSEGLRLVGPAGRYLIVGLWSAPGTVALEPRAVNNANARIIGSALSRPRHLHKPSRWRRRTMSVFHSRTSCPIGSPWMKLRKPLTPSAVPTSSRQ